MNHLSFFCPKWGEIYLRRMLKAAFKPTLPVVSYFKWWSNYNDMSSNLLGVIRTDYYTGPITAKDYEAILHNQLLIILTSYILPSDLVCFLINTNMTSHSFHDHFNHQMSSNIYFNTKYDVDISHSSLELFGFVAWRMENIISLQQVQSLFGSN